MEGSIVKRLAKHHAKVWFYNDRRENELLEDEVFNMLTLKNFDDTTSKEVSKLVRNAYEIYGLMDDEPDRYDESEVFDEIERCFCKAFELLNEHRPPPQGKFYREFWFNFYKKENNSLRNLKILDALWKLHKTKYLKLGTKELIASTKSTIHYVLAGIKGHNKRD
ncbi:hypothetical protein DRP05_06350, partial [Archaeoglobales archaeon]